MVSEKITRPKDFNFLDFWHTEMEYSFQNSKKIYNKIWFGNNVKYQVQV